MRAEKRRIENGERNVWPKSLSPPWLLSSVLMPAPVGPIPLPIPPNTPGVAPYGVAVEVEPVVVDDVVEPVVVVGVPV